jgi:dipeptidyl aminopeptidase/acylaminoacyl peptidase
MSPVNYLKKDSPPLFMIQGNKDTTIPVKHAHRMAKIAANLKAPVKTMIINNSGHNWRKVDSDIEPSRQEIIRATVDFFVNQSKSPQPHPKKELSK